MTTVPSTRGASAAPSSPEQGESERTVPRSVDTPGSGERSVRRSPHSGALAIADLPVGTGRVEFATLGSLQLESGDVLPELTVAYRHDGPGPSEAPQVLVVHALTGSADAAGDWTALGHGSADAYRTRALGLRATAGLRAPVRVAG